MRKSPNPATAKLVALGANCTLKHGPVESSSQKLLDRLSRALHKHDVDTSSVRAVDHHIKPGVKADAGEGHARPPLRESITGREDRTPQNACRAAKGPGRAGRLRITRIKNHADRHPGWLAVALILHFPSCASARSCQSCC